MFWSYEGGKWIEIEERTIA